MKPSEVGRWASRYWGQLPPLGWPRVFIALVVLGVLLICFMTVIALFGVMYVTTGLPICPSVLLLLSSLLRLLIILLLPYCLCCYLLSLLLLL